MWKLCIPLAARLVLNASPIAPDCFPLCLAVIRQPQPGASWPRFTVLCCLQGSTATPGICSYNTYRMNTSMQYAYQLSKDILGVDYTRNRNACPVIAFTNSLLVFIQHYIVLPSYTVVMFCMVHLGGCGVCSGLTEGCDLVWIALWDSFGYIYGICLTCPSERNWNWICSILQSQVTLHAYVAAMRIHRNAI